MAELPPDATCRECGAHFEQKSISHVFCCAECQMVNAARRVSERALAKRQGYVCPMCGVTFTPRRSTRIFCSVRCRRDAEVARRYGRTRAEALAALRCRRCGSPMPEAKSPNRHYCTSCQRTVMQEWDRARRQRQREAHKAASGFRCEAVE